MSVLLKDRLVKTLVDEIASGAHVEKARFLPRRRIEKIWNVSNKTAHGALGWLREKGVLYRANRKLTLLAPGAIRTCRRLRRFLPAEPLPPALPHSGWAEDETPASDSTPRADALLCEHLVKSLLIEITSGAYPPRQRFLSRRAIEKMWKISASTVERARSALVARNILCQLNPRITALAPGAVERACLLLEQLPFSALPPPANWKTRRNRLLHGEDHPRGYRLGVVYSGPDIDPVTLDLDTETRSPQDLNEQLVGKRHLIAFLREANRHFCETLFFRNHGPDNIEEVLEIIVRRRVEGVAFIEMRRNDANEKLISLLKERGISVVTAFDNYNGLADASIECNETAAGYAAMKLLLEHGHRDLLLLVGKGDKPFLDRRREGAMACLAAMGLRKETRIREMTTGSGIDPAPRLRSLLKRKSNWPTAMLVVDTIQLHKLDRALWQSKVRIPQDISVVACGARGHQWKWYPLPDIMERDHCVMGEAAARQLIRLVHGEPVERALQLETPYFPRGTVDRPRESKAKKPSATRTSADGSGITVMA